MRLWTGQQLTRRLSGFYPPSLLLLAALVSAASARAQEPETRFLDDLPVHYIYATVLGTGFYDINGLKAAVIRLPFSTGTKDSPTDNMRWRLIAPTSIGYQNRSGDSSLDQWIPTKILSVSAVPGVELFYRPRDNLELKPFVQLGVGRDYNQHETTNIAVAGYRALGAITTTGHWEISAGHSLQWAREWLQHRDHHSQFNLFEVGMDFKRQLPVTILGRSTSMSVFGVWQYFFNQQNSSYPSVEPVGLDNLYKIGVSFGTGRPYSLLGFNVDTVSVGLSFGNHSYALNFGTGFPF